MQYLAQLALLCVAGHLVLAAPADKLDCSKMDEIIDDLGSAQGLTTLNDKYKLATNEEEFSKRCQEMSDAIKLLKKYNKECYSSLTQQVFSAILRTRSQLNENYCKPNTDESREAIAATKCIQEQALEQVRAAERKVVVNSQVILDSNIADDKVRLRRACCFIPAAKLEFVSATKDKCSKHEKIYSDYVDSYTSEAMSLICPDADKLECDKLEKLATEGVQPKSLTFLNPMLKIVKTLDH